MELPSACFLPSQIFPGLGQEDDGDAHDTSGSSESTCSCSSSSSSPETDEESSDSFEDSRDVICDLSTILEEPEEEELEQKLYEKQGAIGYQGENLDAHVFVNERVVFGESMENGCEEHSLNDDVIPGLDKGHDNAVFINDDGELGYDRPIFTDINPEIDSPYFEDNLKNNKSLGTVVQLLRTTSLNDHDMSSEQCDEWEFCCYEKCRVTVDSPAVLTKAAIYPHPEVRVLPCDNISVSLDRTCPIDSSFEGENIVPSSRTSSDTDLHKYLSQQKEVYFTHLYPEVCVLNISTDSGLKNLSVDSNTGHTGSTTYLHFPKQWTDLNRINRQEEKSQSRSIYNIDKAFKELTASITDIISPEYLQRSVEYQLEFSTSLDTSHFSNTSADISSLSPSYSDFCRMESKTPPLAEWSDSPQSPTPRVVVQNGVHKNHEMNGKIHENGLDPGQTVIAKGAHAVKTMENGTNGQAEVVTMDEQELAVVPSCKKTTNSSLGVACRILVLIIMLYFFICSLDLLSSAFTLLGGRVAGEAFKSPLLQNPICGLMIGVVCTAFLQSSSTSTSIVVTLVASNMLTVEQAIPIIMGANIGTSVTGVLVAVTQAGDRDTFRRAFSAATVHDMFNWLTVFILLPLELLTGYLLHISEAIVNSANLSGGASQQAFLGVLTDPFTDIIVMIDKSVLDAIALGDPSAGNQSLLLYWCEYESQLVEGWNTTVLNHTEAPPTAMVGVTECTYLFHGTSLSEKAVGAILLLISLGMLIGALIIMVKVLKALLQGKMAGVIKRTVNADFPKAAFLTGYFAIVVGAVVTILVQSSSVVSSALTPLAGVGVVTLERVYPMMLGANIGTTSTALLAAFSATGDRIGPSFQIAMCHLFFNLTGILIWFPIPFMKRVPLRLASFLGKTTARYRWFAFVYLIVMFFILPFSVFLLSIPGWWLLVSVLVPIFIIATMIGIINVLQNRRPNWLPEEMRTWEFLPLWMRSLEPMDSAMIGLITKCNCCGCCDAVINPEGVEIKEVVHVNNNGTELKETSYSFVMKADESGERLYPAGILDDYPAAHSRLYSDTDSQVASDQSPHRQSPDGVQYQAVPRDKHDLLNANGVSMNSLDQLDTPLDHSVQAHNVTSSAHQTGS